MCVQCAQCVFVRNETKNQIEIEMVMKSILLLFAYTFLGGEPNKVCKLNIVNLNKQAKLFSQGMHPVIRVGETGKWERTKHSPVYTVSAINLLIQPMFKNAFDHFSLSMTRIYIRILFICRLTLCTRYLFLCSFLFFCVSRAGE